MHRSSSPSLDSSARHRHRPTADTGPYAALRRATGPSAISRAVPAPLTLFGFLLLTLVFALPSAARADWQTGLDAFRAGDLSAAEAAFRAVAESQPDWFGGHRMLGQTLLTADAKSAEGIAALTRALELAPTDVATRYELGKATSNTGQYARTLEILAGEKPAGLSDSQWQTWLRYRAKAARKSGDATAARDDFRTLASLGGADANALLVLAHLESKLGDEDQALRRFTEARKAAEPGSRTEHDALRVELKIRHYRATLGNTGAEAACQALIADAERLVALEASAENLSRAGRIARCAGRDQGALDWLDRSVKAGARDWRTHYSLARQLVDADEPSQAEKVLRSLLDSPGGIDIDGQERRTTHDYLGYLLEIGGRYDEAIAQYRLAGSNEKVAAATESQRIHRDNLEAEAESKRLEELERRLRELENEARAIGEGGLDQSALLPREEPSDAPSTKDPKKRASGAS